jgi:7-carboxy-7-deazaguanine synthase
MSTEILEQALRDIRDGNAEEEARPEMVVKEKRLPVMELFGPTIQGEGVVAGQRTLFIRFGLCDYKCTMCDSMHAVDPKSVQANARRMTNEEIVLEAYDMCVKGNCAWVTLSGGNPAIHDLEVIVRSLKKRGIGVSTETQGTFCPHWIRYCDYITVSPKGPGMGEKFEVDKFMKFHEELNGHPGYSIKVVVFDVRDLEFASMIAEMCPATINRDRFYLSHGNPYPPAISDEDKPTRTPANDGIENSMWLQASIDRFAKMADELRDYPSLRSVRFLPQIHHWIWGNAKGR